LSTDYGVFLLSRIKEFHDAGEPNEEAVAHGLQRTGRVITAAALLFCAAVWTFATSRIVFVKQLGTGIGVAVLVDATIVRALLVPSLMKLLGDWNWWAPRPLRRLHRRLGLSETPSDDSSAPVESMRRTPLGLRTKEYEMTSNARTGDRILGSLRS